MSLSSQPHAGLPPFLPLPGADDLARIEQVAYRLLDEVGIVLQHAAATQKLLDLGCRLQRGRLTIPPPVVQWALGQVTGLQEFRSLDGECAVPVGAGRACFHNSGGIPFVVELETGLRRPAKAADVAEGTRLLDALPNVDALTNLFGPQDVPPELLPVAVMEILARNARKPVFACAERPEHVRYIVEMAQACGGGADQFRRRPTLPIGISPVSPLIFPERIAGAIIAAAEAGAPLMPLPAPSLGATGPITLPGAVAQQHAEVLASILLVAVTRPGTPVLYCSRISAIDLRTAVSSWGGPEVGLSGAWAALLAQRIGLPCDVYGLSTASARLDPQSAYEKLVNTWPPASAGAAVLSGVASLENLLAGSYAAAVIDDEMIGLLRHVGRGYALDDDTLAFDVMKQVIEEDGVFLSQAHTVRQMRRGALWMPGVSDWSPAAGEGPHAGVVARASARARELLHTHEPPALPDEVSRELTDIMARARRELVGND